MAALDPSRFQAAIERFDAAILAVGAAAMADLVAKHPEIPEEYALQGFDGVRAYSLAPDAPGYDLLVIARGVVNQWDFPAIERKFAEACRRNGIRLVLTQGGRAGPPGDDVIVILVLVRVQDPGRDQISVAGHRDDDRSRDEPRPARTSNVSPRSSSKAGWPGLHGSSSWRRPGDPTTGQPAPSTKPEATGALQPARAASATQAPSSPR